jgi:hypothetical protein
MMEGEMEGKDDRGVEDAVEDALGRIEAGEVAQAVAGFARENPHVALAAAAGLGFLLGGGLTPRMLGKLGLLATRGYVRRSALQALQGALSDMHAQGRAG